MRTIIGKFYATYLIDVIETEPVFDEATLRDVLRLSNIDAQSQYGQYRHEKLPSDFNLETSMAANGGFNPAFGRNTTEARKTCLAYKNLSVFYFINCCFMFHYTGYRILLRCGQE